MEASLECLETLRDMDEVICLVMVVIVHYVVLHPTTNFLTQLVQCLVLCISSLEALSVLL